MWLLGSWQQQPNDIRLKKMHPGETQQLLCSFIVVNDHTGDCAVRGIDDRKSHNPQIITFYPSQQVMQRPNAIFKENHELSEARPVATTTGSGSDR
jgi:hypothetical protein